MIRTRWMIDTTKTKNKETTRSNYKKRIYWVLSIPDKLCFPFFFIFLKKLNCVIVYGCTLELFRNFVFHNFFFHSLFWIKNFIFLYKFLSFFVFFKIELKIQIKVWCWTQRSRREGKRHKTRTRNHKRKMKHDKKKIKQNGIEKKIRWTQTE